MKLIKPFRGVPDGEIYPRQFQEGDECPAELLDAARSLGAVEPDKKSTARANQREQ